MSGPKRAAVLRDLPRQLRETIVDACCTAWNALTAMPDRIRSIATRSWTKTVRAEVHWCEATRACMGGRAKGFLRCLAFIVPVSKRLYQRLLWAPG